MQANALSEKARFPLPEDCTAPTEFLDYQHPLIERWLADNVDGSRGQIEIARQLYYLVRDGWRYNPYKVSFVREHSRASHILGQKQSYCIPKAVLLAAFGRAMGIPTRLGFGDVRNHLSSPRLIEYLRSEIFAWHGFTELYLEGRWVRATPAFDARLCAKFRVPPLEFDGQKDSLFQDFDLEGNRFMEYVSYRGVRADLPFVELFSSLAEIYPHLFADGMPEGDLYAEVAP